MAIERFDVSLCNGCGRCVRTCPCDVFRLDEVNKKSVIAYPEDCQVCSMCTVYCPTGSIIVTPDKGVPPLVAFM